jgi:hypothetical protein
MDTPTATHVHLAEHKQAQTIKTDLALRLGPLNQNPPATTMGTKDTMATMES